MRWRKVLPIYTIVLITLSALFLVYVHVHAPTTCTVEPSSGEQTTTFTATVTTTLSLDPGDECIIRWYDPDNNKFRTTYDDESPFEDSWKSGVSDPVGTYTVTGRFYDGQTGDPLESAGQDTFELSWWPVFPSGLFLPIMALCIFFIILNKKLMKPYNDSILHS